MIDVFEYTHIKSGTKQYLPSNKGDQLSKSHFEKNPKSIFKASTASDPDLEAVYLIKSVRGHKVSLMVQDDIDMNRVDMNARLKNDGIIFYMQKDQNIIDSSGSEKGSIPFSDVKSNRQMVTSDEHTLQEDKLVNGKSVLNQKPSIADKSLDELPVQQQLALLTDLYSSQNSEQSNLSDPFSNISSIEEIMHQND